MPTTWASRSGITIWRRPLRFEDAIDEMRDQLNKISRRKMAKKKRSELKGELIFRDIVRHLEHIGDYSLNISQALRLAD